MILLQHSRRVGVVIKVISILLLLTLVAPHFPVDSDISSALSAPVNPVASTEAKAVLQNLYEISGTKIITGQHDYLESPDELNNKLKKQTGKNAGIHGYELGAIMNQSPSEVASQRQKVVNSAIAWNKAGGLVTMTYHESIPDTCRCWSNVQKEMSQSEFDKYVTPGTVEYNHLIADLDEVAVSLIKLKDAGVPVLWRPYHEMNGGWFWWGKKNNFSALWNIMYDRYVNVHKLNNLLWVWSPNAPTEWADPYTLTYPGADKVDILAVDIYGNDFRQEYYDKIVELSGGKPVAIGETGEIPDAAVLENQPKWAYMMVWGKMLTENNTAERIHSFYTSSRSIKRGTVPLTVRMPGKAAGKNGLVAEYYDNKDFTDLKEVREDPNIDFNWRQLAPTTAVQADTFSVRWTGRLWPSFTETYTISTLSDDGIRVWVNGDLVIDSWFNQSWVERSGTIALTAGKPVDFKVEFYNDKAGAAAKVMWASLSQVKEIIPESALFIPK
nr:glycosyl hydrolase [Paenibacillus periandrae]